MSEKRSSQSDQDSIYRYNPKYLCEKVNLFDEMRSTKDLDNHKLIEEDEVKLMSQIDHLESKERLNQLLVNPVLKLYDMASQVDSNGVDCFEYNNEENEQAEDIQETQDHAESIREKMTVKTRLKSQCSWSASGPQDGRSVHSASSYQLNFSNASGEKVMMNKASEKSFEIRNQDNSDNHVFLKSHEREE